MKRDKVVYLHILNGIVVYVGSGSELRVNSKNGRSIEHLSVWSILEKTILHYGLSSDEARDLEKQMIDRYLPEGNLLNRTTKTNKVRHIIFNDLSKVLQYDENSPSGLRWKIAIPGRVNIGDAAGYLNKSMNYHFVGFSGSMLLAHRVVYCLCKGKDLDRGLVIDHIDRNGSNNLISNLREVSQSQNSKNRPCKISNTGEPNISEFKQSKSFKVGYRDVNGKDIRLYFSYSSNGRKDNPRLFKTRELALSAAIEYRDTIFSKESP